MRPLLASKKTFLGLSLIASALFNSAYATSPQTIEIQRDNYGVPHVFADTTYGLFYGYGYAVAQDRLFQIDMARRSFIGSTAEVLGAGPNNAYLNYDISVRQNFNPVSIQRQMATLNQADADIFQGYADGYNAYLAKVKKNPELLPKEYVDYDFEPSPLSGFDVVMIWVGSMANRFSDTNLEVSALGLLQDLEQQHGPEKAHRIFNELRWLNDPQSPTTVPAANNAAPTSSTPTDTLSKLAPISNQATVAAYSQQQLHWGGTGPDFAPKASNLWMTQPHRITENATVLINGPQFGWYNPSYTYGIGLHGAGFDVVGNTPFAYPIVLFGTNSQIAWGATAGPQDVVDIYQLQLNPQQPTQYLFNGRYLDLTERQERIHVRDQKDQIISVWSSHHGLLTQFDPKNQTAYSKKRSWDGYEVQSLLAWLNVAKAQNWEQFLEQAEKMAITINWYYADKDGNIGYVSPGYLPKRPAQQDMRLPAKGDGSMEWEGILSFDAIPKAYNPAQGYLSNWNNRPAPDTTNTDTYFWAYGDRVNELNTQYAQKDQFSLEEIWDFNKTASYTDVNWRYFAPHLEKAADQFKSNEPAYAMVQTLAAWDGLEIDNQGHNNTAARLIFRTWLEEMYQLALLPLIPEKHQASYSSTGFATDAGPNPGSINLSMGTKVLLRALELEQHPDASRYAIFAETGSQAVIQQALENTYARLSAQQGPNPKNWQLASSIHRFSDKNFTGTPQTSPGNTYQFTGYQNRGTENNRVIFSAEGVEFCDAMPPGQSGFMDRHGKRSPHYDDQLSLYENFECKIVDSDVAAIRANATEETILILNR